jgi:hypothetical protein
MPEALNTAPEGGICTETAQECLLREKRVLRAIEEAPESAKGTLRHAFSGSASPRKAIKAMCLSCMGYDRPSVKNCSGYACPLWRYRPFQEA